MLKVRVIPTLLWKHFGLVKGVGFNSWRRVGPVLQAVKVYNAREVDELIFVDIVASSEDSQIEADVIRDFADECFVPLTVGGGIKDLATIQKLLRTGADKVCINTAAYANPKIIESVASKFGTQCITSSIDARRVGNGQFECFSHSGSQPTGRTPTSWARELVDRGAGEILITSIEKDGTMTGYDLDLIAAVASSVNVPVIASGGAGNSDHMRLAIQEGGASAVAAASIFHFTEQTPAQVKRDLANAGIPVRGVSAKLSDKENA
jgi:cyclase